MNKPNNSKIEVTQIEGEAESKARFCNWVNMVVSAEDFLIDFCHHNMRTQTVTLQSRISFPPRMAKLLLKNLQLHVDHYESKFGEIKHPETPPQKIGFSSPDQGPE